ncbi:hypothetical protein [Cyclobacterium sp. SYSU L10401]|uniref:hypothetical protein n=1 Tax=Cyclobacterium sp. SYSU L10401 TaxID=2678657 RepID=UPI0013D10F8F|nr:hypothetical protein [Cyclobacterium sp. SYSU L10401]
MKAYNAKFKYGFLYDQETGKRIILAEGSELTITVENSDVLDQDPYNHPYNPQKEEDKMSELKGKGYKEVIILKEKSKPLFFEISAGFRSKSHEPIKSLFEIQLLENLYGARKEFDKDYDLLSCHCVVSKCIFKNLEFFEPIYAYSLNDAYSKTYDFYFRLYGKQAANAKEKIMEDWDGEKNFLKRLLKSSTSPDITL